MTKKIIDSTATDYPVQPFHISTAGHFWNAFGHSETEISARHIVKLCQKHGGWIPFTKAEIDAFSGHDFWFNRLSSDRPNEDDYVVFGDDGKYRVTHEFISSCFKASPAI